MIKFVVFENKLSVPSVSACMVGFQYRRLYDHLRPHLTHPVLIGSRPLGYNVNKYTERSRFLRDKVYVTKGLLPRHLGRLFGS